MRIILGLASLSFSYGFYRSWTSPSWLPFERQTKKIFIVSAFNGLMYVAPPSCFINYISLCYRIRDKLYGIPPMSKNWREFGEYHPRCI